MIIELPGISEAAYRFADLVVKAASGIGVVVGGVWAVYQYLGGVEIGFRKPLWERQLDLYFQACEAASILANYPESAPEWRDAEKKFWTLYWGPLVVVEDAEHVSQAMIQMGAALNTAPRRPEQLRQLSFNLAQSCRHSISAAWRVKLAKIAPRDPSGLAVKKEASDAVPNFNA